MWSISHCGKITFDAASRDELGESRSAKKARFRTSYLIRAEDVGLQQRVPEGHLISAVPKMD